MSHEHDTTFAGAIVKSVSIENLLNQRDAVIERICNAIALLHEAQNIADAAHLTREYRGFAHLLLGIDPVAWRRFGYVPCDGNADAVADLPQAT